MPPKSRSVADAMMELKQQKKQKLQQAMDSFKTGVELIKNATSRKDLQSGVDYMTTAITLRPNVFRYGF